VSISWRSSIGASSSPSASPRRTRGLPFEVTIHKNAPIGQNYQFGVLEIRISRRPFPRETRCQPGTAIPVRRRGGEENALRHLSTDGQRRRARSIRATGVGTGCRLRSPWPRHGALRPARLRVLHERRSAERADADRGVPGGRHRRSILGSATQRAARRPAYRLREIIYGQYYLRYAEAYLDIEVASDDAARVRPVFTSMMLDIESIRAFTDGAPKQFAFTARTSSMGSLRAPVKATSRRMLFRYAPDLRRSDHQNRFHESHGRWNRVRRAEYELQCHLGGYGAGL